jgi:DNA polymerase-1
LVVADFSQIELRVLAHCSRDRLLLRAYREDIDLHAQTASVIYRVPLAEVTKEQRAVGKTANFALAYGGSASKIADQAGIGGRQARVVHDTWHETYPGVSRWGGEMQALCWQNGYVETLFGRKRRLYDIRSADIDIRRYAERQAANFPIQGGAADLAKAALVQIYHSLLGHDAHLVLQVHDEFVVEVVELVRTAMEHIAGPDGEPALSVPLVADIAVGATWSDAK